MAIQKSNQRKPRRKQLLKQKFCHWCVNPKKVIDYKDPNELRRFTSSFGKIVPRRRSGVCALHQRKLSNAIKRARIMALLPFVAKG
jgi:small subunit ribosomal protein S18